MAQKSMPSNASWGYRLRFFLGFRLRFLKFEALEFFSNRAQFVEAFFAQYWAEYAQTMTRDSAGRSSLARSATGATPVGLIRLDAQDPVSPTLIQ
jgi:hypothetical protein